MSRFIDKLNQVSKTVSPSIGFKIAPSPSPKSKIQLIAGLAQVDVEGLASYVARADAGLLHISQLTLAAETFQKVSQLADIPWGGRLEDIGQKEIGQIVKAGCDFVVFPATSASLPILQNDKVGKILEVGAPLGGGLLRTVNKLPVDAVLIASEKDDAPFLNWHRLMLFHHVADLVTKPLLVSVPVNVTAQELKVLWEAGVNGVIVEATIKQPADIISKLRQTIDKLTFPPRKREKVEALLPYTSGETGIVTEEED